MTKGLRIRGTSIAIPLLLALVAVAGAVALRHHPPLRRSVAPPRANHGRPRPAAQVWSQDWAALRRTLSRALPAGASPERVQALVGVAVAALAREQLPAWVRWAERGAPPEYQQALIGALLERWAESDAKAAAESAASLSSVLVSEETMGALYRRLAAEDAPAAARFAASLAPAQFKDAMLAEAISQWAQSDWSETIDWLAALPEGRAKKCGVTALLATADAAQCSTLARCVQSGTADDAQLQWQLAATWARSDPGGALDWAGTLPAGAAQDRARAQALASWADHAPLDAAVYAIRLPDGAGHDEAVMQVVSVWSQGDASAAARWVETFADSPVRAQAVDKLISIWAQTEPQAAADWLARMPGGPALEAGISALARGVAPTYPWVAFRWASALASPADRTDQQVAIARAWLATDGTAARPVIEESDLPRGVKDRLYSSIPVAGRE